jgi:hypothetical protein
MLKIDIVTSIPPLNAVINYRSVQLMQGSMVRIRIGTSASAQPFSVSSKAGILAKVGVLTLILSKNFEPLPFA